MKGWLLILMAGLLSCGAVQAKKPQKEADVAGLERQLAQLDAEIERLSLELNRKTWDCYAILAERGRRAPRLSNYPGVNLKALRDSVPEIEALYARYDACYKAWQEILRTAPEYAKLHEEYRQVKNLPKESPRFAENKAGYDRMFDSLRIHNPAYRPAVEARDEALFDRDMAVLRYVMAWYREQGRRMPVLSVVSREQMNAIREEWPEVGMMENNRSALRSVRYALFKRLQQIRYDLAQ